MELSSRRSSRSKEQDKQIAVLQGENWILAENNKETTANLEQAMVQAGSSKKQLKSSENKLEHKLTCGNI